MQIVMSWKEFVLAAASFLPSGSLPLSYNNYVVTTHCVLHIKMVEWQSGAQCVIMSGENLPFVFSPFPLQ